MLPQLVEAAIATHPAVAQCAVFGVPDDRLGQRVVAAVVPIGEPPSLEQLRAHVAASLDSTAAPRELHLVDELPVRGIGKVDRRALAERYRPALTDRATFLGPSLEDQVERGFGRPPEPREVTVVNHHLPQPRLAGLRAKSRSLLRE